MKVRNLMFLERILLEIESKFKFELDFNDAYKLHNYLITVGKVTSYMFLIQDEFNEKYNDIDKLKEYHSKVIESSVDFAEESNVIEFIERVQDIIKDDELNTLIHKIRYW